jgi:5-deoxy-glucuronate isomerase
MKLHHTPNRNSSVLHEVTPENAGWEHLSFKVVKLETGQSFTGDSRGCEELIVFVSGSARASVGALEFEISGRSSVFAGLPTALYVPPNSSYTITASGPLEFSVGGAPAEGKYPVRLYQPHEFQTEMRGGANVSRQIVHLSLEPVQTEKLFVFEVYSPSGNWSGFPPHRHDGRGGSSYLEETYYFKITPENGFGVFRVYTKDTDLDEIMVTKDSDLVLVPEGYHPGTTAPGSNLYFLNYLAGPTREYTVVNDPDYDWVKDDWTGGALELPMLALKPEN